MELTADELRRYSRHLILPEVGLAGQKKICSTSVLCIGAGGLGSPAGSCLWHVIGLEQTIRQWAMLQEWRRKHLDQETASGILIAALGILEQHFQ